VPHFLRHLGEVGLDIPEPPERREAQNLYVKVTYKEGTSEEGPEGSRRFVQTENILRHSDRHWCGPGVRRVFTFFSSPADYFAFLFYKVFQLRSVSDTDARGSRSNQHRYDQRSKWSAIARTMDVVKLLRDPPFAWRHTSWMCPLSTRTDPEIDNRWNALCANALALPVSTVPTPYSSIAEFVAERFHNSVTSRPNESGKNLDRFNSGGRGPSYNTWHRRNRVT